MKSEYYDGRMFAISGGSLPHSLIAARLIGALLAGLRGKGCDVVTSDLRVRISDRGPYVYPDATVHCGRPELADHHKDILLNPAVVFEVLSESTERYDRGYKFSQYRSNR